MKINKGNVITMVITILVCIAIFRGCGNKIVQYWEDPNFKTDTVYKDIPYTVEIEKIIRDTFRFEVPPKIVYRYITLIDNGNMLEYEDSLLRVIDSLGIKLEDINPDFLTNFPSNPKLIYGLFRPDTIRLDLLNIDGEVYSEIYLTDYDKFQYQWVNNGFRADKLRIRDLPDNKKNKRKLKSEVWVSPGYSMLDRKVTASADYYLRYKRYQANVQFGTTIESVPQFMLQGKLGFRLTK